MLNEENVNLEDQKEKEEKEKRLKLVKYLF
jgi:hypothetical protein